MLRSAFERVHIVDGIRFGENKLVLSRFPEAKFVGLNEAPTVLIFTGGADINPNLYKEQPHPYTSWNSRRDVVEVDAYFDSSPDVLKIGICRGAQLLNVLNGGKLFQHVEGHAGGSHPIKILDSRFKINVPFNKVISVHHQMMRPTDDAVFIASSGTHVSKYRQSHGYEEVPHEYTHEDTEVVWYPKTRSFCFQSHPEFGDHPTKEIFFDLLNQTLEMEKVL